MPSRRLQTLCVAIFLACLLLMDKSDAFSLIYLIPALILMIASFILSDRVNAFWYARYPPGLNNYEKNWMNRFVPYYAALSEESRLDFEHNLALELSHKEFLSMEDKPIPEEHKMMALAPAIYLGLDKSNKLAEHYNRVVFYFGQFPSPNFPFLHSAETEHEDGVILLSIKHLESAYRSPEAHFNIAVYQWAEVFARIYPPYEHIKHMSNEDLEQVCCEIIGTQTENLKKYLGLPNLNGLALVVYCYLLHNQQLKVNLPVFHQFVHNHVIQ